MHDSKHRRSLPGLALPILFGLIALGSATAQAQRSSTASRIADIAVFGGFTYSSPDYGSFHDHGITVGADYTRFSRWNIDPSFEVRANHNTGKILDHEAILAGLLLKTDFRRFHPYADLLGGGTKIIYHNPPNPRYTNDVAFVTSVGGGVDIDLVHSFQLKVDYQQEFMNFGPNGTKVNNADFTLTPSLFTVGVVYRIPSHARHGEGPR